jgi:hypothetical protein
MKKYFFAIIFLAFNQAQANTIDVSIKGVKENVVETLRLFHLTVCCILLMI